MTTVSNKTFGAARTAVKITSDICDLRIFFAALLLKKNQKDAELLRFSCMLQCKILDLKRAVGWWNYSRDPVFCYSVSINFRNCSFVGSANYL